MSERRTSEEVKKIVEEYDPSMGLTQEEYCKAQGISTSTFHRYRHNKEGVEVVPVKVEKMVSAIVSVKINGTALEYNSAITDHQLRQLLRCLK